MYDHVIVPFDGSIESRTAFAPAADLAWRCGAKLVIVSVTTLDDEAVRVALKQQAMARSGADVDFWVDPGIGIGEALLAACHHRSASVLLLAAPDRRKGILRTRTVATELPEEVTAPRPPPGIGAMYDVVRSRVPTAGLEVIQTARPAAALVAIAGERADAAILLPASGGDDSSALGPFAEEVIRTSRGPVILAPPGP